MTAVAEPTTSQYAPVVPMPLPIRGISPQVSLGEALALMIGSTDDPGAVLTQLLLRVSRDMEADERGQFLHPVVSALSAELKSTRADLLASVVGIDGKPVVGDYGRYMVTPVKGSRKVDYKTLASTYPDAYAAVVSTGEDTVRVTFRSPAPETDDAA